MSIHPSLVSTKINGVFASDEVFCGAFDPFFAFRGYPILSEASPCDSITHFENYRSIWNDFGMMAKFGTIRVMTFSEGGYFGIPTVNVSDDYSDGT